jgi:hypothetical protein
MCQNGMTLPVTLPVAPSTFKKMTLVGVLYYYWKGQIAETGAMKQTVSRTIKQTVYLDKKWEKLDGNII